MNVFESQAGHDFINYQFPELIRVITRISEQLDRTTVSVIRPLCPADANFLNRLYAGDWESSTEMVKNARPDYRQVCDEAKELADKLFAALTPAQTDLLEAYTNAVMARAGADVEQAFVTGARTTMQFVLAGLVSATPADACEGDET